MARKRFQIYSSQSNSFEDSYDEHHEEIFNNEKNVDSFVIDSHDSSSFGHDVVSVPNTIGDQPILDEYDDDLKNKDPDMCNMEESN